MAQIVGFAIFLEARGARSDFVVRAHVMVRAQCVFGAYCLESCLVGS